MAPRANWKGFLRLSLVTCPVTQGRERPKGNADADRWQEAGEGGRGEKAGGQTKVGLIL
jgi:hypothetical protein